MASNSPSFSALVLLIVLVLVIAGVGAYLLYQHNHPAAAAGRPIVAVGDNVTVNYVGSFGSGPEQGRVFDTSIRVVADSNATYPKSLEYTPRNASGYTPLGVHVGPNTPSSGYSINGVMFGGVVTGFWQGLVGLPVNQTHFITIRPGLGYGPLNPSCLRTVPLEQSLPSQLALTPAAFAKAYPGVSAYAGVTFTDPTYGWTDSVLSSNNTSVAVGLFPTVGSTTSAPGWPVLVTAVSNGTISLENLLTVGNHGAFLGKLTGSTVCSSSQFTILSVNPNGTFTENFNREVVGQTLIFQVTVVAIVHG